MFLKESNSGDLVDVIDMGALINPFSQQVTVQYQSGQDLADPVTITKENLIFPSGEALPECWLNGHYRLSTEK